MSKAGLYPLGTPDGNETYLGVTAAGALGVLKRYAKPGGNVFETKAEAQAATIASDVDVIVLTGCTTPGDAAQVLLCKRRVGLPVHEGYVQTAGGAIFEYVQPQEGFAIEWWGGQGDHDFTTVPPSWAAAGTDNWPAWEKARKWIKVWSALRADGPTILFRQDRAYFFSQSIQYWSTCNFIGQNAGVRGNSVSTLVFPPGVAGFIAHSVDPSGSSTAQVTYTFDGAGNVLTATSSFVATDQFKRWAGGTIRGLNLYSYGYYTNNPSIPDTHEHGVMSLVRLLIDNCVFIGWRGDAVRFWADVTHVSDPKTRGNANGWRVRDIVAMNIGNHGIHTEGSDANAGRTEGGDFAEIGGYAVYDYSGLGANKWDSLQCTEVGLRNSVIYGSYRYYELTSKAAVPPGGVTGADDYGPYVTSNSSTAGDVWQGPDGYQWTRRDRGKWVSGTTYAAGDIVFSDYVGTMQRCDVSPGTPSTVIPNQIGAPNTPDGYQYTIGGYTWTYLYTWERPWKTGQVYDVGEFIVWGAHIFSADDIVRANDPERVKPGTNIDSAVYPITVYSNFPAFISNSVWRRSTPAYNAENDLNVGMAYTDTKVIIDGGTYACLLPTAETTFINCYAEGGSGAWQNINWPATIIGGLGSTPSGRETRPPDGIMHGRAWVHRIAPHIKTKDKAELIFSEREDMLLTGRSDDVADYGQVFIGWDGRDGIKCFHSSGAGAEAYQSFITTDGSTSFTAGRGSMVPAGSLFYPVGFFLGIASTTFATEARKIAAAPAMPTTGTYARGDFVFNTFPAVAAGKVLLGWSRLTTGTAHVVNTDWSPLYCTTT